MEMTKETSKRKKRSKKIISRSDMIFYIITGIIITLFFIVVLYPILFVLAASFSSGDAVSAGKVFLWPVEFSLDGYKTVFNDRDVLVGFRNSLIYMIVGTAINVALTMCAAYALTRVELPGINKIMFLFTFTMFFGGGMIPKLYPGKESAYYEYHVGHGTSGCHQRLQSDHCQNFYPLQHSERAV